MEKFWCASWLGKVSGYYECRGTAIEGHGFVVRLAGDKLEERYTTLCGKNRERPVCPRFIQWRQGSVLWSVFFSEALQHPPEHYTGNELDNMLVPIEYAASAPRRAI